MGRPPCCVKVGIKKGPWTPEEDIILVSYVQEHGPGNWRSVPTNTGLLRCSKSCRLRWTNYLRPGIKRGNFTPHEEGMIIHLQALLGNKWAAIASYLPQRTDNDIKNYWNTHLKKKLKNKFQSSSAAALAPHHQDSTTRPGDQYFTSKTSNSFNERIRSSDFTNQAASNVSRHNQSSSYASSTENISRLLQGWMRSSPKISNSSSPLIKGKEEDQQAGGSDLITNDEFKSILSFEQNLNNVTSILDKSNNEESSKVNNAMATAEKEQISSSDHNNNPPLSFLENWLFDESTHVEVEDINQITELSDSIF